MKTHSLLGKFALLVIAGCLLLALISPSFVRAQSPTTDWEKAAGGKLSFEAASVKANDSGPSLWTSSNTVFGLGDTGASGILRATNVPLITYIAFAYKLDPTELKTVSTQLPDWARRPFYDIEAQTSGKNFTKDQVRLMTQSLLADRFKLAVHWDAKDGPAYALVLAKAGKIGSAMHAYPDGLACSNALPSRMVPTVSEGRLPAACGQILPLPPTQMGSMHEAGRNVSMDQIIEGISIESHLDRPLMDRTGLTGTFDMSVEFSRALAGTDASPGTAFLEAVSDQLGFKVELITAQVRSLVIDHIQEPTPN